jgi:hypothetical protein
VCELLQKRAVAAADLKYGQAVNAPVRRRFIDESTHVGELRASHARVAEWCSHLRAKAVRRRECARDLLIMTLDDQAGMLIHADNEAKSIRKRVVAWKGPVAYLKREHADVPARGRHLTGQRFLLGALRR